MKNKKIRDQKENKAAGRNHPMRTDRDVAKNPDKHIDQDFTGYPHAPSSKELINPKTKQEKKSAALSIKDGEKNNNKEKLDSNSPANAPDATETVKDDE